MKPPVVLTIVAALIVSPAIGNERWEPAVQAFEKLDQKNEYSEDSVLFVGSSSIRMWDTMAEDMAPFPVIQRGYGGAKFQDLAVYAERIINPHDFAALVLFVGNDISGKADDIAPEEVGRLFAEVVATARKKEATAPIFLVAVTPTPSRFGAWPQIKKANAEMEKVCDARKNVHYISTEKSIIKDSGEPDPALFRDDLLHLNTEGYKLWSGLIRDGVKSVLGNPTP